MTTPSDETRLIEQAANGERRAFGELVLLHQAAIRGYVARFVPDSEEVFDIAQNVFIQAFRSLKRFNRELDFSRWLTGIATNLVRQHLRRESRLRARHLKAFEETLRRWQAERLSDDPERDRLQYLRECVGELDDGSRRLIERRYLEGIGVDALASELSKSVGALAMQFLRIRASLAQCVRGKLELAR